MKELAEALIGESAHVRPVHILEALPAALAHRVVEGAPHTIYAELWHIAFWLGMTLAWCRGLPTPYPARPDDAFPNGEQVERESWDALQLRFTSGIEQAAALAKESASLDRFVVCPSPPDKPARTMTVEDQLVSLAAHNSYHLGRIVLLRQLLGTWPPPSGGFSW